MSSTEYIESRRRRVADLWDLRDEVVLIGAGEPIPVPGGADQTYPFRSHSEYFYLTDCECPGGILAFDPHAGWTSFTPEVTEDERVWEGRGETPGTPITQLAGWLGARRNRPVVGLGCELPGVRSAPERVAELRAALFAARRPKDEVELERMRQAAAATAAGYAAARPHIRPGVSEREIQIELEDAFRRAGGDGTAYGTIVGSGPNAAVLHFCPSSRRLSENELMLIDAGAEVQRYACDVTRTYPASDQFSGPQRELYDIVLRAEENALRACVPGAEWKDIHLDAACDMAEGLVEMGILRGHAGDLVDRDAHALFFPHGLGHMVGLGVRDASGYLPGRTRSPRFGLNMLRCDFPLEAGFVMTVEPGLYFIPPLLNDPSRRERYRDCVNWSRVEGMMEFGGIRIEDNVLVTRGDPVVLTEQIAKRW